MDLDGRPPLKSRLRCFGVFWGFIPCAKTRGRSVRKPTKKKAVCVWVLFVFWVLSRRLAAALTLNCFEHQLATSRIG